MDINPDVDPQETREWLDAIDGVLEHEGPDRAHFLIEQVIDKARRSGAYMPFSANTAYINTIPVDKQVRIPGDQAIEHRIRSYVRWNAMAMVVRANKHTNVGGHIASFASAATLYDTGFNHFWHAPSPEHGGDLVFVQGHSAPGVYARAHMLGRFTDEQMDNFRQEVDGKGVSSYPHPWLMPDFWQFPTVSMGLGPLMAIYQARFMKYLQDRGLAKTEGRKVWCFCGDGEMDEPESMGAIGMAARESLDNLIFVINCNLQRLDGPVRGNGKIIQELEADFRGAGWNVIKVIWGSRWDPLLARDKQGILMRRMMECVDGEYQTFKSKDGAYVREYFFNTPELKALVADYSDEDIWNLNRGGHDPHKVYAAYRAAVDHKGQPTIILAKTIKGYGMGEAGEAQNITHQQKKMSGGSIRHFRDRFQIPVPDDKLDELPYVKFPPGSAEAEYMKARRMELGGFLPTRRRKSASLAVPGLAALERFLKSTEDREISTTMAFVQILQTLLRDKNIGKHIVPIVPDESRTFGMEGMFRQLGHLEPARPAVHAAGRRSADVLQGEQGRPGAAGGHQRARRDVRLDGGGNQLFDARRTDDPVLHLLFDVRLPARRRSGLGCRRHALSRLPARRHRRADDAERRGPAARGRAFARLRLDDPELRLVRSDLRLRARRDHPGRAAPHVRRAAGRLLLPDRDERELRAAGDARRRRSEHHQGHVPVQGRRRPAGAKTKAPRVQLLGSGVILREAIAAAELLKSDWGVDADIWSCTSFTELAREGEAASRWNMMHPTDPPRVPHVTARLADTQGPVIAATDYVRAFAGQIREFVPRRYVVLGTDGFGRSDTREKLRRFFEVDRWYITVAALKALADDGTLPAAKVAEAISKYGIDAAKAAPWTV